MATTIKELVVFSKQFAVMLQAGLPLVQALQILANGQTNKKFQKVILGIKESVESGTTLTEAFQKFPNIFDSLFISMIEAGEKSGSLDLILARLANKLEKNMKLQREVRTAFIYPLVVTFIAIVVTAILLYFVVPTFAEIFAEVGSDLPLPTRVVIALSDFVVNNALLLLVLFIAFCWLIVFFPKTEKGKTLFHPILIKLPFFGEIIKKVSIARFARTLSVMLSSGVDLLSAIKICSQTAGNVVVGNALNKVVEGVNEGKTLSEPLIETHIFSDMVSSMIQVGEVTGNLDTMLTKIADFFEDEVESVVSVLKQLIEPVIIFVLGIIIGALVISMYLPIFKLGSVV